MTSKEPRRLDLVAVGCGPANLALAIAMDELAPNATCLFLEQRDEFNWHPGMLLDGAGVQNSYLKDLVTLRNPTSPHSFLAFLKDVDRLHWFLNLDRARPSRWEFNQYFQWVADRFAHWIEYGQRVVSIEEGRRYRGRVASVLVTTETETGRCAWEADALVLATGRRTRLPPTMAGIAQAFHASEYLLRIDEATSAVEPGRVAVVGAGQSGAEVVRDLLDRFPETRVEWIIRGPAPRPADDSPFVNDVFMWEETLRHLGDPTESGHERHMAYRNANYGVVDLDLIYDLYRRRYEYAARDSRQRLVLRSRTEVIEAAQRDDGGVDLLLNGSLERFDVVVCATGFVPALPAELSRGLMKLAGGAETVAPTINEDFRLRTAADVAVPIFLQGVSDAESGIGDSLFPIMPHRAHRIATQVVAASRPTSSAYFPERHREGDQERLSELVRERPLATFITSLAGQTSVSTIPVIDVGDEPLTLLFGHVDANNPQAAAVRAGAEAIVVFHGGSAYIHPDLYATDQLPTWNFESVQVRGRLRELRSLTDIRHRLVAIAEVATDHSRFDWNGLRPDDPRIEKLAPGIVAFHIDVEHVEGRFKLSQDRNSHDRCRAAEELDRQQTAKETP